MSARRALVNNPGSETISGNFACLSFLGSYFFGKYKAYDILQRRRAHFRTIRATKNANPFPRNHFRDFAY